MLQLLEIYQLQWLVVMVQFKKKLHGPGTTVKLSNEEINDMVNIVKTVEDSDILMKGLLKH